MKPSNRGYRKQLVVPAITTGRLRVDLKIGLVKSHS